MMVTLFSPLKLSITLVGDASESVGVRVGEVSE